MTRATRSLIVHADDFGIHSGVNDAVLTAFREGILTSTSLLPNGTAYGPAAAAAKDRGLDVGVHLSLVQGAPVSKEGAAGSLTPERDRFHPTLPPFLLAYAAGRIRLDEVRTEWAAQIEKVVSSGLRPSHLDSHMHVHLLPGLFSIAVELAKNHRIPCIRIPQIAVRDILENALHLPGARLRSLALGATKLLFPHWRKKARRAGLRFTDRLYGFLEGGRLRSRTLDGILRRLPVGTSELVCHPGYETPSRSAYFTPGFGGRKELDALLDPEVARAIAGRGIRLRSFRDLAGDLR